MLQNERILDEIKRIKKDAKGIIQNKNCRSGFLKSSKLQMHYDSKFNEIKIFMFHKDFEDEYERVLDIAKETKDEDIVNKIENFNKKHSDLSQMFLNELKKIDKSLLERKLNIKNTLKDIMSNL